MSKRYNARLRATVELARTPVHRSPSLLNYQLFADFHCPGLTIPSFFFFIPVVFEFFMTEWRAKSVRVSRFRFCRKRVTMTQEWVVQERDCDHKTFTVLRVKKVAWRQETKWGLFKLKTQNVWLKRGVSSINNTVDPKKKEEWKNTLLVRRARPEIYLYLFNHILWFNINFNPNIIQ